jgi:hypothetical protein
MKEITPDSVIVYNVEETAKALDKKYRTIIAVRGGTSKTIITLKESEDFFGVKFEIPKIEIQETKPIYIPPPPPYVPPPVIPTPAPYVKPMVTVEKCRKCDGDGIVFDMETRKIWNTEIALYGEKRTPPKQCPDCDGTGTKRRPVK